MESILKNASSLYGLYIMYKIFEFIVPICLLHICYKNVRKCKNILSSIHYSICGNQIMSEKRLSEEAWDSYNNNPVNEEIKEEETKEEKE